MSKRKYKPQDLQLKGGLDAADSPLTSTDSPDGKVDDCNKGQGVVEPPQPVEGKMTITDEQRAQLEAFDKERGFILSHGELKEQLFERIKELGFGNGGVVLKMEHKPTGVIMARKMILLDIKPSVRNGIMRELNILQKCKSPYIVGFYGNFYVNNEISICMQHMDGGSLDLIMKAGRIPIKMIPNVAVAVLSGLKYLHDVLKIIHRDVKPSNILVNTKGEIKLCDFGVSGQLIDSMALSFVGTRSYMAPERLEGAQYTVRSDIWSLGVSLVEMSLGCYPIPQPPAEEISAEMMELPAGTLPPRQGGNPYASCNNAVRMPIFELLQIITTSEPPTLPAEYFSKELRAFVDECLSREPNKRSNIDSLLKHPFISTEIAKNFVSCAEFADWVQRSIQAVDILEKQEIHN